MSETTNADQMTETYKSLIAIAVEGFKFLALANGGAAVAILAYLGNIAVKGVTGTDMRCAMICFVAGLVLCGLSMISAYCLQLNRFNKYAAKNTPSRNGWLYVTLIFSIASLAAFGIGSMSAVSAFTPKTTPNVTSPDHCPHPA